MEIVATALFWLAAVALIAIWLMVHFASNAYAPNGAGTGPEVPFFFNALGLIGAAMILLGIFG